MATRERSLIIKIYHISYQFKSIYYYVFRAFDECALCYVCKDNCKKELINYTDVLPDILIGVLLTMISKMIFQENATQTVSIEKVILQTAQSF